jgi:SAM-dependent methyltransferase
LHPYREASHVAFQWPDGFERIPDEPWTREPVEALARNYDTVENHGWYSNLDHSVEQITHYARRGDILIDYSGGTGILARRLLDRLGSREVGIIIVDSSPKFLRLALEKFQSDERLAFRHIRYLRDEGRIQKVDEVLGDSVRERGVDGILSTNAIHLYFGLEETVRAWRSVLRPSGRLFIQSGNIRHPELPEDQWIIDETVDHIHRHAIEIVRSDPRYAAHRDVLAEPDYMADHDRLRKKYFLPVRPLAHYLDVLRSEGFEIGSVEHRRIPARVSEWYDFLSVYHEGVLGWFGGAEKITGKAAPPQVIEDRLSLMREALQSLFGDAFEFGASWTYVSCEPRP